jgi:hypothetical protein
MRPPPDGARLLRLELEPAARLTLGQLSRIEEIVAALIREVGGAVVDGDPDSVRWYVESITSASPIRFELRPEPATDAVAYSKMPEVVHAVAGGLAQLELHAERPPFFTDRALERAADLVDQLGRGLPAIRVGNATAPVPLTARLKANVTEVLGERRFVESFGTVEGRLETVSVHDRRYFNVYDELTGERIECHFGGDLTPSDVGRAVGRRVAVTGLIRSRTTGEIVSVQAEDLYVFPDPENLPSADDVLGILAEA